MVVFLKRLAILLLFWCFWAGRADAEGWQHFGSVQHVEKLKDGIELTSGKSKIRITQVHDGVLRVRAARDGVFGKDFSWALTDELLDFKETISPIKVDDSKSEVKMTAGSVTVLVKIVRLSV